eukprot:2684917-Rhodomonas_salina.6
MIQIVGKENHIMGLPDMSSIQDDALWDLCRFRWDNIVRSNVGQGPGDGGLDVSVHSQTSTFHLDAPGGGSAKQSFGAHLNPFAASDRVPASPSRAATRPDASPQRSTPAPPHHARYTGVAHVATLPTACP